MNLLRNGLILFKKSQILNLYFVRLISNSWLVFMSRILDELEEIFFTKFRETEDPTEYLYINICTEI